MKLLGVAFFGEQKKKGKTLSQISYSYSISFSNLKLFNNSSTALDGIEQF